jgi:hypothetical protein
MVKLITREDVLVLLRKLTEKLEENNKQILIGKVKAVQFGSTKELTPLSFRNGQLVFTKRGIGIVEGKAWVKNTREEMIVVRHRKTAKKNRVNYRLNEVMRLVVVDTTGNVVPVSPMFYDHLVASIDKEVKFYINERKYAMLTRKQQENLRRDQLASLKGAFNLIAACRNENLW